MKIESFVAVKVHGYMPIRIKFHEDCNFFIGLNGSGKTSALRLLTALIAPNLEELAIIDFESAEVQVVEGGRIWKILAEKGEGQMILSVDDFTQPLRITAAQMQYLVDSRYRDDPHSPIKEALQTSTFYKAVQSLPTPIFLGIERRTAWSANADDIDPRKTRFTKIFEYPSPRANPILGGIGEVNQLVRSKVAEIRAAQVKLDDELRVKFFTKAFEYKPARVLDGKFQLPTQADLAKYRSQLGSIDRLADNLKLPAPEMTAALTSFFDQMSRVVSTMEAEMNAKSRTPTVRSRGPITKNKWEQPPNRDETKVPSKEFVEWLINIPQADRVIDSLELFGIHEKKRTELNAPIKNFLDLVNSFFSQTKKVIAISDTGDLVILHSHQEGSRQLSALASGERQLLTMIGHLILNPDLMNSGVFMVDEPELSLHIAWQERFVDAVTAANPSIQLILATHSPAIVMDRDEKCIESLRNFEL